MWRGLWKAIVTSFWNSHQEQHLLVLCCLWRNQEGRNNASLDVQDVCRLIFVWVKDSLFPFRNGQLEFKPIHGKGGTCSQKSLPSTVSPQREPGVWATPQLVFGHIFFIHMSSSPYIFPKVYKRVSVSYFFFPLPPPSLSLYGLTHPSLLCSPVFFHSFPFYPSMPSPCKYDSIQSSEDANPGILSCFYTSGITTLCVLYSSWFSHLIIFWGHLNHLVFTKSHTAFHSLVIHGFLNIAPFKGIDFLFS